MSEDRQEPAAETAAAELRAAWDYLLASLSLARDAIDHPELMPPPSTARKLAEGYRYLMGFVHSAVERAFHEDVDRPAFRNALSIINRATIDNADAIGRPQGTFRERHAAGNRPLLGPSRDAAWQYQRDLARLRRELGGDIADIAPCFRRGLEPIAARGLNCVTPGLK